VGYELSPAGQELLAALVPLAGWGAEHSEQVLAAREQFDRLQQWRSNREAMQARSRAGAPPMI
jgi:DNA-binding HxlR family transcriptional regulator